MFHNSNEINVQGLFIEGDKYIVTWDGTEYTCVCRYDDGFLYIGNNDIIRDAEDSDGLPFIMATIPQDGEGYMLEIFTPDTSSTHTVSVRHVDVEKKPIDEALLPVLYHYEDPINIIDAIVLIAQRYDVAIYKEPTPEPPVQV